MRRKAWKFFKTPKGLLTVVLVILIAMAAPGEGIRTVMPGLIAATIAAGLADLLILRVRNQAWEFPGGAVLTAMIVAMVLRAQEPWYVTTVTSVIAILSKYLCRSRTANVFNPAALAIVASFYVFHTGQSWWGALTEVTPFAQPMLLVVGIFITDKVNKMPLVLTFLGTYFLLFTVTAFVGEPRLVSEIFRAPDLEAALYCGFIILTDPPTSPAKYPDQIIFGMIVAIVGYAFFEWAGVVYFLLAGVLAGNVWEAWRRANRRTGHRFPKGTGRFLREIGPLRRVGPAAKIGAVLLAAALTCFGQTPQPAGEVELPDTPGLYAVIETSMGRMVALLYDDIAPLTVKNFVDLAKGTKPTRDKKGNMVRKPYFNGLTFHRVIKGFMIQTGDVKGTGAGDCGVPNIRDEFSTKVSFDNPGTLAMANTGRPNSGSCQFFITVGRASYLDGKHTIFGQIVLGQEVAVAISEVPTGSENRPKTPVIVKSIAIQSKR